MESKKVFRNLNQFEFDAMSADVLAISNMLDSGQINPTIYFRLRILLFHFWFPEDYLHH